MVSLLFRSTYRILKKDIALSLVKISSLSIGIATFLITALYYNHELSYDKQHPKWENIFRYVHRVKAEDELQSFAFTSATTGPALKETFSDVVDFTRILKIEVSLMNKNSDIGFAEKNFAFVDPNFLHFFSFPVSKQSGPNALREPYSVILTPSSAMKYFGDADPIGKSLLLNGAIELIVQDVFKEEFSRSHMNFDFVASFATLESIRTHPIVSKQIPASLNLEHKGFNAFYTYLRLTDPSARSKLEERFPAFIETFRGKGRSERLKPALQPLTSIHLHSDMLYELDKNGSKTIVMIYLLVGSLILIAAIINYINITTAEFINRTKGIGLKKLLGVNKTSLVLGYGVETMVICGLAMMVGASLTIVSMPLFNVVMRTSLTFFTTEVIFPFISVYFATTVLSALLPVFTIVRQDALVAFRADLKVGASSHYLRNSLVFIQLLVSFVLLACALLIGRQTDFLLKGNRGFDADQIIVVNAAAMHPDERLTLRNKLRDNVGIEDVSMCSVPPGESLFTFGLTLPGAGGDQDRPITCYQMFVDENLLRTLGIDLIKGRYFDPAFASDSLNSFVVNSAGAKAIHDSLLTRVIEIPNIYTGKPARKKAIGVVDDFHFASFHNVVAPLILEYNPRYTRYLLVRFDPNNTGAVIQTLEKVWAQHAPLLPMNYYFMDDDFAEFYQAEQQAKYVVVVVSWLAIILSALGIFGTSLFFIQRRTKEIAVRKIFGSGTSDLLILLFRPIIVLFILASCIAVPISTWIGEQWLEGYPYHTTFAVDILLATFAIIFTVILVTLSTYILRIHLIQPAKVLQEY